ncbi:MAG: cell wall hydrolase [Candidatus Thiodiazotropha taylori]|nr:cell wall hydrolase [Candidatus Thiodiazotropha taylori]MCG8091175.1 cell wall hydrolase [Candidatus Thiodiazotropha taylori]MCW4231073.1 cell wall hydrolase [Candidatus Thiodiazotropha taylori]MCW4276556.1 cell wall hydrolase [Candidatus Thiodiazotropha taylori]
MKPRTTTTRTIACMAKLLFVTLFAFSSGIQAAPMQKAATSKASDEDPSNLWRWLFHDVAQQSIALSNELHCLALNIYFEARSESAQGQYAVGHVVMNRVAHQGFPDSICAVVKQGGEKRLNRCQFSWWCDGRSDKPINRKAWLKSLARAFEVYLGQVKDPTYGALWYHADYVSPKWSKAFTVVTKIGHHLFYHKGKQPSLALNLNTGI